MNKFQYLVRSFIFLTLGFVLMFLVGCGGSRVTTAANPITVTGLRSGSALACPQALSVQFNLGPDAAGVVLSFRKTGDQEWIEGARDTESPFDLVWDCTGLAQGNYEVRINPLNRQGKAFGSLLVLSNLSLTYAAAPAPDRAGFQAPHPDQIIGDFQVAATILDPSGNPLAGATGALIRNGSLQATSQSNGNGVLTLAMPAITVSETVLLKVSANGYLNAFQPLVYEEAPGGQLSLSVSLKPLPTSAGEAPKGVVVDADGRRNVIQPVMGVDPDTGQPAMVAQFDITPATKQAAVTLESAEISFGRADGQGPGPAEILGAAGKITATMLHGDPASAESFKAFPGSFSTMDAGETGEGQGVPGALVSAGFVKIDIAGPDGREITSFAPGTAARVSMKIPPQTINPQTGEPIKEGDVIQVWSFNETTGHWDVDLNPDGTPKLVSIQKDADGNLTGSFQAAHLTYWNLDWKTPTCPWDTPRFRLYDRDGKELQHAQAQASMSNQFNTGLINVFDGLVIFRNMPSNAPVQVKFMAGGQTVTKTIVNCRDTGSGENLDIPVVFGDVVAPVRPVITGITPEPNSELTGKIKVIRFDFDQPMQEIDHSIVYRIWPATGSKPAFWGYTADLRQWINGGRSFQLTFNDSVENLFPGENILEIRLAPLYLLGVNSGPVSLANSKNRGEPLLSIPGVQIEEIDGYSAFIRMKIKGPDQTAPKIIAVTPAPGEAIRSNIRSASVTFNETMQRNQPSLVYTLTNINTGLSFTRNTSQDGAAVWSSDGKTLSFTLTNDPTLQVDSSYRLTFTVPPGTLMDLAGNSLNFQATEHQQTPITQFPSVTLEGNTVTYHFTVQEPDATAPKIITISPAPGVSPLASTDTATVTFNEPMRQNNPTAVFTIHNLTSGLSFTLNTADTGSVLWSGGGTALTFKLNPYLSFNPSSNYRLELTVPPGTLMDLAGNSLDLAATQHNQTLLTSFPGVSLNGQTITYNFSTQAPDATRPKIISLTPAPGAAIDGGIRSATVYFSEPMFQNSPTATISLVNLAYGGVLTISSTNAGSVAWSANGTALTFYLSSAYALSPASNYQLNLAVQPTSLTDLSGNPIDLSATEHNQALITTYQGVALNGNTVNYSFSTLP